MKTSSTQDFKNAIDKAFTTQPNVKLNPSTMQDALAYKKSFKEQNELKGGVADKKSLLDLAKKHSKSKDSKKIIQTLDSLKKELEKGMKVELEHTKDKSKAKEIAMDHLSEDPKYYQKLNKIENNEATSSGSSGAFAGPIAFKDSDFLRKSFSETPKIKEGVETTEKVEAKEATGSGSVGGYSSPAMWAKSTKKKDWGPSRKTQYKGGAFVKVKKKCTKFPYCNQGDINALKLTKNESVKEAILSVAKKMNLSETVIINILEYEYSLMKKRNNQ